MKILFVNARNDDEHTSHSRNGMYVPLGILSVITYARSKLGDRLEDIAVIDEDVSELNASIFKNYDLVGFYATTFNYLRTAAYAKQAKESGAKTVLGGPHGTVLTKQVLTNKPSFDFVIREEGEIPFEQLLRHLLGDDVKLNSIPSLGFRDSNGKVVISSVTHINDLATIPIISREYVPMGRYVENYHKLYGDRADLVQGSIFSSKGCNWRDVTDGGCVFCARLEIGMRFRPIPQIWEEIRGLKEMYGVNSIWDISDDNLNSPEWFKAFVDARPTDLNDVSFFIYSRVGTVKKDLVPYFKKLNVEEIFVGAESGDNTVLKRSFKGQTVSTIRRATKLLRENDIRFFPSFILGLPGENIQSLENTYELCKEIADQGGANRLGVTILQPIPGCSAYNQTVENSRENGVNLDDLDEIQMPYYERAWAKNFTDVDYDTLGEYKEKIDAVVGKTMKVFGGRTEKTKKLT